MPSPIIPYGRQFIDEDDIAVVTEVLKSDWLTGGSAVTAFEGKFAETVHAPQAISCSSGTAALHLSAMAMDIRPGDNVVVPAITFLASANAFQLQGAKIIFADVDPVSGLMTPDNLEQAIVERAGGEVKAVVPVHLGGRCTSPSAILKIARKYDAFVVEDACHSIGTTYDDGGVEHRVGSCAHSDITAFSLHPVKTITMGEGGVATTKDAGLANRMASLRSHGVTRNQDEFKNRDMAFAADGSVNPWYYEALNIGLNYRASDIHCGLGLSQLVKLPAFLKRRQQLAERYDVGLRPLDPIIKPVGDVRGCDPALHLYAIHVNFSALGMDRAKMMRRLESRGIMTQVHYIPLHLQPCYRDQSQGLSLSGAEEYYESTLSIPLYPSMTESEQSLVIETLEYLVNRAN